MAATSSTPLMRTARFLASIQMAMALILACAIAMIYGTIIESRLGAETAQALVYRTWWFWGIEILIGLNLLLAVVLRLPLKRHQYSFAVVHAGFILMLAGALTTSMAGYEGMLTVYEGAESNVLVLRERQLVVESGEQSEVYDLPVGPALNGRRMRQAGDGLPGVRVLEYLPRGIPEMGLQPAAPGGEPGLSYSIVAYHGPDDNHNHGPELQDWMMAGNELDSLRDHRVFKAELLRFDDPDAFAARAAAAPVAGGGYRVTIDPGSGKDRVFIDLPAQLDQAVDLGDGLTATVSAFAEHSVVAGGTIQDNPGGRLNPAASVVVSKDGVEEVHTVYSKHPDFTSKKGGGEVALVTRVGLQEPAAGGLDPAFRFLVDPQGALLVQEEGPDGRAAAVPVVVGRSMPIQGMAYALVVDQYLPSARQGMNVQRMPSTGDRGLRMVLLELDQGGQYETAWLRLGERRPVTFAGQSVTLGYIEKKLNLPFKVALHDFQLENHPGSRRAAEYASEVTISSLAGEEEPLTTRISMNRTLDYMGYRLFQSSYDDRNEVEGTVLSINNDPGSGIVYWSYFILIFGIGWYVLGDGRKKRNGKKNGAGEAPSVPPAAATTSNPDQAGAPRGAESLETVS